MSFIKSGPMIIDLQRSVDDVEEEDENIEILKTDRSEVDNFAKN